MALMFILWSFIEQRFVEQIQKAQFNQFAGNLSFSWVVVVIQMLVESFNGQQKRLRPHPVIIS